MLFRSVICSEHGWPDNSIAVTTVRVLVDDPPPAKEVASRHLAELYSCPGRAEWLDKGAFSGLPGKNSSPATAAGLALSISRIAEDDKSREKAAEGFRQWPGHLNRIFAGNDGNADGRALLIAAAFLDGAPALEVQQAARQLLGDARTEKRSVRDILGGPNLTARLKDLGVTVEDRRVSFSERPGLGRSALHHIWQERVDLHDPLLKWIAELTAAGKPAALYLDSIAEILTTRKGHRRAIGRSWPSSTQTRTCPLPMRSSSLLRKTRRLRKRFRKDWRQRLTIGGSGPRPGASFGPGLTHSPKTNFPGPPSTSSIASSTTT